MVPGRVCAPAVCRQVELETEIIMSTISLSKPAITMFHKTLGKVCLCRSVETFGDETAKSNDLTSLQWT